MAYYDDDCDSDAYQSADELLGTPDYKRHQPATPATLHSTFQSFKLSPSHTRHRRRRRHWPAQKRHRIILVALVITGVIAISLYLTYITLTTILLSRLAPPADPQSARLHTLLSTWRGPADSSSPSTAWLSLFTGAVRDVAPVPCHSHNDYWRPVPLFSALAVGCVGVEADIWLPPSLPPPSPSSEDERQEEGQNVSSSPLVSHTRPTLDDPARTLRSLYIDPLVAILSAANAGTTTNATTAPPVGVYARSPATTLVLLLDFKERDAALWDAVVRRELAPLRERGWLTYWSEGEQKRVVRPVTAVVTGAARLEAVEGVESRDVFFDAPLEGLEGSDRYNAENSYYASVKLSKAVGGRVWGSQGLSGRQAGVVRRQVAVAAERGLVSRYWGTPGWPVAVRNRVWEMLVESGVGVLNVDELTTAVRWDWRFCTVLGITICN